MEKNYARLGEELEKIYAWKVEKIYAWQVEKMEKRYTM
jgi:hypothetical protein